MIFFTFWSKNAFLTKNKILKFYFLEIAIKIYILPKIQPKSKNSQNFYY